MAFYRTPYAGMTQKKMAATLKVYKRHTQNLCVRFVTGLHESSRYYQLLPEQQDH